MAGTQFGEVREQSLRGEQRHDAEAQAQHLGTAGHRLHRVGEAVDRGGDGGEEALAIGIGDHRLMAAVEQGRARKRSSVWIRRLRAGGDKASSCAAAFTEPSRATATNASIAVRGGRRRIERSSSSGGARHFTFMQVLAIAVSAIAREMFRTCTMLRCNANRSGLSGILS